MKATVDDLRARILDIRQTNYDLRPFVPQNDLCRLLTLPVVSSTLKNSGVNKSRLSDLAQSVYQGACKVFAVLVILKQVQYTLDLVGHDQFRDLDQQMRFRERSFKVPSRATSMISNGSSWRQFSQRGYCHMSLKDGGRRRKSWRCK